VRDGEAVGGPSIAVGWPGRTWDEARKGAHVTGFQQEGELSEDQLDAVVGGLARVWVGTTDDAELGDTEPMTALSGASAETTTSE
jgi:hypothetical protein